MVSGLQSQLPCNVTTNATCISSLSTSDILSIQNFLYTSPVYGSDPTSGGSVPFRMINDGTFITSPLDSTAPLPSASSQLKPALITFVNQEGTPTIYLSFNESLPADEFEAIVAIDEGSDQIAQLIAQNPNYLNSSDLNDESFDARAPLADWITDQVFRCPGYTFAQLWAGTGTETYVGVFERGSVYVDSVVLEPICSETQVCHEGDIEILVCIFIIIIIIF